MVISPYISGSLAVFYPCRIKETRRIKRVLSLWKQRRQRQLRQLHNARLPLTELMDAEWIRDEMDDVLKRMFIGGNVHAPYATQCIQEEFRETREGKQHSKETNIVLSRFRMSFLKDSAKGDEKICHTKESIEGILIFSLNLDNLVGTFVVNLNFTNLTVDDIIFLKHVFYKRYTVSIDLLNPDEQSIDNCDNLGESPYPKITIPEFVISQSLHLWKDLKWDIDFRARYSLLEINKDVYNKDAYGLLMADECYDFVPEDVIESCFTDREGNTLNLSTRINYKYFVSDLNGIIINLEDRRCVETLKCRANEFFGRGCHKSYHHEYNPPEIEADIAGVGKGRFRTFLKAIELHYLVNVATTNEIEVRQQSHVNPFVFLKRAYRLWEIIYELDMNPYHRDDVIIERFGITKKIAELREEYKSILNLTIGYATVLIAIFTLAFTIIQICR